MDRRNFLKGSSAAALAVGTATATEALAAKATDDAQALASPALVAQRRRLRMLSLWPDAVAGPGDHVRRFAKRIEAATDGGWVIEISDRPMTEADAFKAVMVGDADLYVGHEHAHRALHPAFSYFAGLPCGTGMSIDQMNAWLVAAGGQELWDDLAAEFNMKGLVIGHSGRTHGLFTRRPVHTSADLRGKRIATVGLAADVLLATNAMPVDIVAGSARAMNNDASVDGIELYGTAIMEVPATARAQFHQTANHRLRPGLNDTGFAFSLGLRRSLWDGFANAERILLSALAAESLAGSRAETLAETRSIDMVSEEHAHAGSSAAPGNWTVVAEQLSRIAETIVADLAGHDDHTRRINASYMAFKGGPRPVAAVQS